MKKFLSLLITLAIIASCAVSVVASPIGTVIGQAQNTDIVAYINNYAIPSYAVNGTSVIVAEDLRNFGFDVNWNQTNRTLSISRNYSYIPTEMSFVKYGSTGSKYADLLSTDIVVFADGVRLTSYAINGYTMIPIEELTMFGTTNWVQSERAIKLWVDGLHVRQDMQPITIYSTTPTTPNNVYSQSAFDQLKSFLIANGEYNDGDYSIYHYGSSGEGGTIIYDMEENKIRFFSIYEGDSGNTLGLVSITPYSNTFDYIISAEISGTELFGLGNMARSHFTYNTTSVHYTTYELPYDSNELLTAFQEIGAVQINLALAVTDLVLTENYVPVTLADLGFTNYILY